MSMGAGNLGAPPQPPWAGSKLASRAAIAAGSQRRVEVPAAAPSAASRADRCGPRGTCWWAATASATRAAARRTPSGSSCHVRLTAASTSRKAGRPWRRSCGEVGPAVERLAGRGQEEAHRPATLAGEGLHGIHVQRVEVGPFLAVHLDGHETGVQLRGRGRVTERLVRHHVAPVAGRVADRQEDRPIQARRPLQRLRAPGEPVDRVVGVLQEVRAGLRGQAVGRAAGRRMVGHPPDGTATWHDGPDGAHVRQAAPGEAGHAARRSRGAHRGRRSGPGRRAGGVHRRPDRGDWRGPVPTSSSWARTSPPTWIGLAELRACLQPRGGIWVVFRKGRAATLRDVEVMAAARAAGLIDNKVVGFSVEPHDDPPGDPARRPTKVVDAPARRSRAGHRAYAGTTISRGGSLHAVRPATLAPADPACRRRRDHGPQAPSRDRAGHGQDPARLQGRARRRPGDTRHPRSRPRSPRASPSRPPPRPRRRPLRWCRPTRSDPPTWATTPTAISTAARPTHVHGPRLENAILDIGGDVGALILYTDAGYAEREIEVSLEGDDEHRTHTAIHERRAAAGVVYAGIYPELRAGRYRIWADRPGLTDHVTIVGGEVAEVDWR